MGNVTTRTYLHDAAKHVHEQSYSWTYVTGSSPNRYFLKAAPYTSSVLRYQDGKRVVTSKSTRPWIGKKPTELTNYVLTKFEIVVDRAQWARASNPPEKTSPLPKTEPEYNSFVIQEGRTSYTSMMNCLARISTPPTVVYPEAQAANALRLKLKDEFNAAIALAEANKAGEMVANRLKTICGAFLAVKRGNIKHAANILGNPPKYHLTREGRRFQKLSNSKASDRKIASHWLELQYGWIPLLSDVEAAWNHYKQTKPRPAILRKATWVPNTGTRVMLTSSGYPAIASIPVSVTTTGRHGIKYVINYKIDDRMLVDAQSVGLTDPLSVAWELLPYSFVIDWFLPVGNFLASLTATLGSSFVSGTKTYSYDYAYTEWLEGVAGTVILNNNKLQGGVTYRHQFKNRVVIYSFPDAALPVFKNPFSKKHVANAIALLRVSFKK